MKPVATAIANRNEKLRPWRCATGSGGRFAGSAGSAAAPRVRQARQSATAATATLIAAATKTASCMPRARISHRALTKHAQPDGELDCPEQRQQIDASDPGQPSAEQAADAKAQQESGDHHGHGFDVDA